MYPNGEVTIEKQETISEQIGVNEEFLKVLQEGIVEY